MANTCAIMCVVHILSIFNRITVIAIDLNGRAISRIHYSEFAYDLQPFPI